MDICKMLEGLLINISTAALLGLVAWSYNWLRNYRLEKDLQIGLTPNGIGTQYEGATNKGTFRLHVYNNSHIGVQIHHVILSGGQGNGNIRLAYDENSGLNNMTLANEISQPKFNRISLAKGFTYGESIDNCISLPPKTMGVWFVSSEKILEKKWDVNELYVAVEYPSIFGNSVLVKLKVPSFLLEQIKESFNELVAKCHKT